MDIHTYYVFRGKRVKLHKKSTKKFSIINKNLKYTYYIVVIK